MDQNYNQNRNRRFYRGRDERNWRDRPPHQIFGGNSDGEGGPLNRGGHHPQGNYNMHRGNALLPNNYHNQNQSNNQIFECNLGNRALFVRNDGGHHPRGNYGMHRDNALLPNNYQNERQNRPPRRIGYHYLKQLTETEDVEKIILDLSNDRNGFSALLDSSQIKDDLVVLLVTLVWKICSSSFQENKIFLLNAVLQSRFMEKLTWYVTSLLNHGDRERKLNSYFWSDPDQFWTNLLGICKKVQELIPSRCETVLNLMTTLDIYLKLIEAKHLIHISDQIKNETKELLEITIKTINDLDVEKAKRGQIPVDDEEEPPDDFRQIPIIPNGKEVMGKKKPFLRKNIIDRAFKSVDQYLDIQFRLLREDFLMPLRKGIHVYLDNQSKAIGDRKKLENIKIYRPVRFLCTEIINEGHCYKLKFDFSQRKRTFNYQNSKKFMYGSLVCFTCDNFVSFLFGKIVNRNIKDLENGELTVGFQEAVLINLKVDYVMIECSVYFEPYYHVLNALQKMNPENFPMEKYIIRVETTINHPRYLLKETPVNYKIDDSVVPVLEMDIEDKRFYGLNDSQWSAFKAGLTDEFSVIQGPPGTGKTFLGLKIVHTLIHNQHAWYHNTPILVICYTNHALDQFLEGLLPVTRDILRVGSQSKNEKLNWYSLLNQRRHRAYENAPAVRVQGDVVYDLINTLKSLQETLKQIEANECIMSFQGFQDLVEGYSDSWFGKANDIAIKNWLMEGKNGIPLNVLRQTQALGVFGQAEIMNNGNEEVGDDEPMDVDKDPEQYLLDDLFGITEVSSVKPFLTLETLHDNLRILQIRLEQIEDTRENVEPEFNLDVMLSLEKIENEIWNTKAELQYLTAQLEAFKDPRSHLRPRHVDMNNPATMPYEDRWRLYYTWLDQYAVKLRRKQEECTRELYTAYRIYNEIREMGDIQIMRKNLVVGMTTTGAARLQTTLQALRSPIVIVEEAAEVLESHIVASLTNACEHLILIGDHLQLKPGAASYQIETTYQLGVSLFERMVRNNIKCNTLNVQHRMRPEISRLIKPHIYPDLEDHESTLQRLPILGIDSPLYFINHQEPEVQCEDSSTKNVHESKFLIALARHLILNGYKPEQITILAAYLSQFFEMLREKNFPQNKTLLQDVRISVLDNYQGEESDIILLSLVRSNKNNSAGFLKIQNRVCVALSRARNGFYIIGNMDLLLKCNSENQIWENVNEALKQQNAIGSHLSLHCQIHHDKISQVSKAEDFDRLSEGGCDLLCEAPLACGHKCKSLCHILDRNHAKYLCTEKCTRVLCNDPTHICPKRCFEDCGPCSYIVTRHLDDCEHDVDVKCHIDMNTYKCEVPVFTTLPCDHKTNKPCHADANIFQCPFPCDSRVEPCGHICYRKCHIRVDPDHLKYICREPCSKPKVGCQKEGDKHICDKICSEECEECNEVIQKERSCTHRYKIACKLDVETIKCLKPCKRILSCGHQCIGQPCYKVCDPCREQVVKVIPECHHSIKVKCCEKPLKSQCISRTCPKILPCGHDCKEPCRFPCTTRCTEMVECDLLTPCGHRIKQIRCYLKDIASSDDLLEHCTHPCGVQLKCGHKCTGTCSECQQSRMHKRCTEKCGVPLVCNHECPIPCRESCKPCTKPCEIRCKHNKCKKKCGEPCTPCQEICSRRCKHVQCKKKCWEICDIEPCQERCTKTLKCGHQCVGFCGDPCPPLCRICNPEELTEIFFGTEEDEDAIFVYLNDCKHVLEHTGLEQWLNQGENEIAFKVCPKCKRNITTTERYSNYIKKALEDVVLAKEHSFGKKEENEHARLELLHELDELEPKLKLRPDEVFKPLNAMCTILKNRLQNVRNQRIQSINKMELNGVKSKIQTITYIFKCFDIIGKDFNIDVEIEKTLRSLIKMVKRAEVTNQEVEDLQIEIKRLSRIVYIRQINSKISPDLKTKSEVQQLQENIEQKLLTNSRYSDDDDDFIKDQLKALMAQVGIHLEISDQERMEIVKAIGLEKGHWFKCPNGHPYAIGECGGAMETAECVCGAAIGGTGHRLLPTNQLAGDMDGASRHAWPGSLY